MLNGTRTLAYSECDTYDWDSDYQCCKKPSRCLLRSKRHRRELTVEICELLVKFAEYSRHDSTISCRYLSHPMTGGLFIYIPFVRTKLRAESLPVDMSHEGDQKRTNHKFRCYLDVVPDARFYFQLHNAKIDVSYARMVKKPPVQSCFVEKEEMWGARYPNKRYAMDDSIRCGLSRVLNIVMDKFKSCFLSESISDEYPNKLLFTLKSIAENLNSNQFASLQHVLNEFGKFFHDSAIVFSSNSSLRYKISRLEIEFENQLEIHFGEWNSK